MNLLIDNNFLTNVNNSFEELKNKGIVQIIQKHTNSPYSYNGTTSRVGTEIEALRFGITTVADYSKIHYELLMSYEVHTDNVFFIQRVVNGVVTEIGSGNPVGSRRYGFFGADHGEDVSTTPNQGVAKFIDSPNVPAGTYVEYRVRYYGSGGHILRLNWCYYTGDLDYAELTASNVILTEIGD